MLCGGIITPTAAMAQSFPQPAPASQAAQNPHQVPKPFEVGILKWSQDVYNAGHTSEQEAQRCSSATPMTEVMRLFDETKAWKMPVVDEEGRYLGFISKSAIFNSYREVLNCTFIGD